MEFQLRLLIFQNSHLKKTEKDNMIYMNNHRREFCNILIYVCGLVLSVFFILPSCISAQEIKEAPRSLTIPSSLQRGDIVVAQDGSSKFKTVQEALNAVPENSDKQTIIFIKNGLYKEKLVLSISKKNVTIIGESVEGVILTYDDHSGKLVGSDTLNTFNSFSTNIEADGFTAENVTFENSAGRVGQAVAIMVKSDKVKFIKCRFIGNQDTFFTNTAGRIYVRESYIEGTTDFIFGNSIAVFEKCILHSKKKSHVTAASTPEGNKFGYVFLHCKLTADSGIKGVTLGRPWRPYAKAVYISCEIGTHIDSVGWNNWKKPDAEKTTFYAEYKCTGPGSVTTKRVSWSRQLNAVEATEYTLSKIFSANASATPFNSDWNPLEE